MITINSRLNYETLISAYLPTHLSSDTINDEFNHQLNDLSKTCRLDIVVQTYDLKLYVRNLGTKESRFEWLMSAGLIKEICSQLCADFCPTPNSDTVTSDIQSDVPPLKHKPWHRSIILWLVTVDEDVYKTSYHFVLPIWILILE